MKLENILLICMILMAISSSTFMYYQQKHYEDNIESMQTYYQNHTAELRQRIYNAEVDAQKQYINAVHAQIALNNTKREQAQCLVEEVTYAYDNDLDLIAHKVATANEYVLNVYDCSEFSRDLAKEFKDKGYDAKQVIVTTDCDSPTWNESIYCGDWKNNHAITEVTLYYEATTGARIEPYQYKDYGVK